MDFLTSSGTIFFLKLEKLRSNFLCSRILTLCTPSVYFLYDPSSISAKLCDGTFETRKMIHACEFIYYYLLRQLDLSFQTDRNFSVEGLSRGK